MQKEYPQVGGHMHTKGCIKKKAFAAGRIFECGRTHKCGSTFCRGKAYVNERVCIHGGGKCIDVFKSESVCM